MLWALTAESASEGSKLGTGTNLSPHGHVLSLKPGALTGRLAVEANGNGCGLYREAAGQTAQHRLNREAFGFLPVEVELFLQLPPIQASYDTLSEEGAHRLASGGSEES